MSKPSLQHRSALAGHMKTGRIGFASGVAGVEVREVQGFTAVSILAHKGQTVATAACLSRVLEAKMTDGPKRVALGSLSVSGVAPGQWLAIERDPLRPTISDLRASLAGLAAAVVQSDSRIVLVLAGERVRHGMGW